MNKLRFILAILLLIAVPSLAQKDNEAAQKEAFSLAEYYFKVGSFENAEKELLRIAKSLKGMHKTSAYRLLALCELEKGDQAKAKIYVNLLLKTNPYYTTTLEDPQRFIDLVNEAKSQSAGITTASRQVESIEEAPVPVTLITEDMIRFSGANTIQELLCLYVPGMSNVEGIETNVAMHGIYGLTQDKILILQDGHRLNGSSTNAEAPDYRNMLDKIQQIEVLRGPASSLYGNVALTAVVNIITRKGASLNGGRINGTFGTQGTYGTSFVVGGGNNVVDVTGWGSIYGTEGFKHSIQKEGIKPYETPTTELYSGAYNKRPSYDIGIKARWGDFTMTFNSQRSKKTPYVNILQLTKKQALYSENYSSFKLVDNQPDYSMNQNYTPSHYSTVESNGPGITRTNHHLNLDYTHSFGNIDFQASGYMSMENTCLYNVMGDSIDANTASLLLLSVAGTSVTNIPDDYKDVVMTININTSDVFQVLQWENISFGGQLQMLAKYNILGHGTAVFGTQYDHFALTDGTLFLGGKNFFEQIISGGSASSSMTSSNKVFSDGMEDVISFYAQIKHYFTPRLIVNAGLRYDHKNRFSSKKLDHFSPRISVIYKLTDALSTRASYNYSFVDAPYIYRASNISLFSGGADMAPETMQSYQAGLTYHRPDSRFSAEISGYYNVLTDLVSTDLKSSKHIFHNSGKVKQGGVDGAIQYSSKRFFLNGNATWQRIFSSMEYNVYNGNRYGIPELLGNITAAWSPYSGKGKGFFGAGKLWLNTNATLQSKTYYQSVDVLLSYVTHKRNGIDTEVPAQAVIGLGATYQWKYLDLNVTVKNIMNNEYMVGSILYDGVPCAGRQILGKLTIKF